MQPVSQHSLRDVVVRGERLAATIDAFARPHASEASFHRWREMALATLRARCRGTHFAALFWSQCRQARLAHVMAGLGVLDQVLDAVGDIDGRSAASVASGAEAGRSSLQSASSGFSGPAPIVAPD